MKKLRLPVLLFVSVLLMSCVARSPYPMSINLKGEYRENVAEEVLIATYESYRLLRECKELQKDARKYNKIVKLQRSVIIRLITDSEEKRVRDYLGFEFCGFVSKSRNTVYLNPYKFGFDSRCEYVRTIGHEMLHLGGFNHRNKKETEAFDKLLYECSLKQGE